MQDDFDCHQFVSHLASGGLRAGMFGATGEPHFDEIQRRLAASYEILNIEHEKLHASLILRGLSVDFLNVARRGHRGMRAYFQEWASARLGKPLTGSEISPTVVEALLLLEDGQKYALSPWTGGVVSTRDSIGPEWHLFADRERGFISGKFAAAAIGSHDTVWIIPGIRKILFVDAGIDAETELARCSQLVLETSKRIPALVQYLNSCDRRVVIADWQCEHFGHYVWNVLSAWGALFEMARPERIEHIVSVLPEKYFGNVAAVFGAADSPIEEVTVRNKNQIYDLIFRNGLLVTTITSHHISENTAKKIVAHSMRLCDAAFRRRLDAFAGRHWPIVLLSLRLDNRAWVDQLPGFADLAQRVRADFPDAGFVIHGLSQGVAMGSTTAWMSLEADIAAAAELERLLGDRGDVISAVGLHLHESVAISVCCDAFLAPVGSGMALFKWLTNKPGVALSNRFCLDPENPRRWAFTVFDHCRENIIPARPVPLAAITDVEAAHHGEPSRANFTVDRAVLYQTLHALLRSLPPRPTGQIGAAAPG